MFVGFDLIGWEAEPMRNFLAKYYSKGYDSYSSVKQEIHSGIDPFVRDDGSINGSQMQEHWFPQVQADVFISHSHRDERLAIGMAGLLWSEFGLKSFIDSCVWGYAGNLLRHVDEICRTGESTFSYEKRNYTTSHVHMMLATALTMMMDQTECVMFLDTPSSITVSRTVNETESPWIYHEISMTKHLRRKPPARHSQVPLLEKSFVTTDSAEALSFKYNVDLGDLTPLTVKDLAAWAGHHRTVAGLNSLDALYATMGLIPKELVEELLTNSRYQS